LVFAGTVSGASDPTADLTLTIDDIETGEVKVVFGWPKGASPRITYQDWQDFRTNIDVDITNSSNLAQVHLLCDRLSKEPTAARMAGLILAPQDSGFKSATATTIELYNDRLEITIEYTLNSTTGVELRPLAFIDDIMGGSSFVTTLVVTAPKKVHLETTTFLLNHIRTHKGERIGGSASGMSYLDTPKATYNTTVHTLTLEPVDDNFTPTNLAGALVLLVLITLIFMIKMGKEGLEGLLYVLIAIILFVFVSIPHVNYIFLAVVILGIVRQILKYRVFKRHRKVKTEVTHDMLSALKEKPVGEKKKTDDLMELSGSGNILARLFPFKIKELFMIYNDGRLICHATLKVGGTVDSQMVSSMLTAIQDFISDSFKTGEEESLENIKYGKIYLFIQRCEHIYLAAVVDGNAPDSFSSELNKLVHEIEDDYRSLLKDWNGDTTKLSPAKADMEKFIQYWSKS